jgi:hypothetical protein
LVRQVVQLPGVTLTRGAEFCQACGRLCKWHGTPRAMFQHPPELCRGFLCRRCYDRNDTRGAFHARDFAYCEMCRSEVPKRPGGGDRDTPWFCSACRDAVATDLVSDAHLFTRRHAELRIRQSDAHLFPE